MVLVKKTQSKKKGAPEHTTPTVSKDASASDGKACAVLAYFLVGIIWYFVDEKMKSNELAKIHVKQALVLLLASIIVSVAGAIIPIIGWFIIGPIGGIIVFVLWIIGIVYAATGKVQGVPLLGNFADKLKL